MKVDPKRMDILARVAFAPVYPLIARQIVDKLKITKGICIDIGSGPASLAIALAKITNLTIFALDISPEMKSIADANITEENLNHRIHAVIADVHDMPFGNDCASLIVSRGSIFFWENRPAAFKEICRILKPGGVAYCGGGFGSEEMKAEVASRIMASEVLDSEREMWRGRVRKNLTKVTVREFRDELIQANVPGTVARENAGIWVQLYKRTSHIKPARRELHLG